MLCVSAPETQAGSAGIAGGPGVATAPTSGPPQVATVRVAGHVAGSVQPVGAHAHRISFGFLGRALRWKSQRIKIQRLAHRFSIDFKFHTLAYGFFIGNHLERVDADAGCTLSLHLFKDVGGKLLLLLHLGVVCGGGGAERCRRQRRGDE
jgi:hypothetical protein